MLKFQVSYCHLLSYLLSYSVFEHQWPEKVIRSWHFWLLILFSDVTVWPSDLNSRLSCLSWFSFHQLSCLNLQIKLVLVQYGWSSAIIITMHWCINMWYHNKLMTGYFCLKLNCDCIFTLCVWISFWSSRRYWEFTESPCQLMSALIDCVNTTAITTL